MYWLYCGCSLFLFLLLFYILRGKMYLSRRRIEVGVPLLLAFVISVVFLTKAKFERGNAYKTAMLFLSEDQTVNKRLGSIHDDSLIEGAMGKQWAEFLVNLKGTQRNGRAWIKLHLQNGRWIVEEAKLHAGGREIPLSLAEEVERRPGQDLIDQ